MTRNTSKKNSQRHAAGFLLGRSVGRPTLFGFHFTQLKGIIKGLRIQKLRTPPARKYVLLQMPNDKREKITAFPLLKALVCTLQEREDADREVRLGGMVAEHGAIVVERALEHVFVQREIQKLNEQVREMFKC